MAYVRRSGPTRHPFVEDLEDDDPTWQRCSRCYLPAQNAIHNVPEVSEEQREHEQRRVGER